jgi:hypothetical protein
LPCRGWDLAEEEVDFSCRSLLFVVGFVVVAAVAVVAVAVTAVGGECVGGCEIDEPTAQIFEKECPSTDVGRDFRSLDIASLPRCDIFDSGAATLSDVLDCWPQGW